MSPEASAAKLKKTRRKPASNQPPEEPPDEVLIKEREPEAWEIKATRVGPVSEPKPSKLTPPSTPLPPAGEKTVPLKPPPPATQKRLPL